MIRIGVIGVGHIGRIHARVVAETAGCELAAIVDSAPGRAEEVAARHGGSATTRLEEIFGRVDAAIVAAPTDAHRAIVCRLLESGIDCLVEKPIAGALGEADHMIDAAERQGRILQVGHVERFNPALQAAAGIIRDPRFIEVHRLGSFVPRSLDIDVVLDLMIHDIDVVLSLVGGELPLDIRAVGVPILTKRIDICNARLEFSRCVANLTASRVYRDKVRKVRVFQPDAYVSLDYKDQAGDIYRLVPGAGGGVEGVSSAPLAVTREEPFKVQLRAFLDAIASRHVVRCTGPEARHALRVALDIVSRASRSLA